MGNQESLNVEQLSTNLTADFDTSSMTYLYHVENSNLLKCNLHTDPSQSDDHSKTHKNNSSLFFLQKIFVSDSEQEYKLLSKYLHKQSLFNMQPQSSQILKIVKIYQESQKGLCSNRYFIKALFEYSDITLREELKIRASNRLNMKSSTIIQKNHFRYEDLCSIMFACISALFTVQKMKNNFKDFVERNIISKDESFRHLEDFLNQFRYNIPLNLDRLIIMQDGSIKVMHPLLIDHDNRIHHSNKFFYSPQKMKDFVMEDGIKGRLFETALVVLQCAMLQNTEQMSKVYNGYCINESILKEKIETALEVYSRMEQMSGKDLKLFGMLKKMTEIDPQKRIGLNQCINEADNLFQVNKKLKQSANSNVFEKQAINDPNQRMHVEELEFIPYHRIAMKASPLQNSTRQSTGIKVKDDQKTTARIASHHQTAMKNFRQNPQIQVSHFDPNIEKRKSLQKPQETTQRNPLESLFICNNDQELIFPHNQEKCLQSLIGKGSDLYNTQKYNFLQSKFQYKKFYFNQLKNSQIDQKIESNASSCKNYKNSYANKEYKYKKLLEQSARNSSDKKSRNSLNGFHRERFLREGSKVKYDKSMITNSKFMEMDHIYEKYDFISKTNDRKGMVGNQITGNSFVSIKNNQTPQKIQTQYNALMNDIPFTFSLENSVKESSKKSQEQLNEKSYKSQVLQKITSELIYQKLKRNKMLR